jgi:hypothetical protein
MSTQPADLTGVRLIASSVAWPGDGHGDRTAVSTEAARVTGHDCGGHAATWPLLAKCCGRPWILGMTGQVGGYGHTVADVGERAGPHLATTVGDRTADGPRPRERAECPRGRGRCPLFV